MTTTTTTNSWFRSYFVEGGCAVVTEADRHESDDSEVGARGVKIGERGMAVYQPRQPAVVDAMLADLRRQ